MMVDEIPVNRELMRKAISMRGNTLKLELFADQFHEAYGIYITTREAEHLVSYIESGSIPRQKIYFMALVLLDERF